MAADPLSKNPSSRAFVAFWWNCDTLPRLSEAVRIVLAALGSHLKRPLLTASCAVLEHLQVLAAKHATAPQRCRASVTVLYLPREVFFGRLDFAGVFVPVCASDFGRFFPATSGSFRLMCSRWDTSDRGYPVPVRFAMIWSMTAY
jgi:hypothetical protein